MAFPPVTHVALTVPDLATSIAWYSRLFGTPPLIQMDEDTFRSAVWAEPVFGLHQHDEQTDIPFDERSPGLDHVAFGVTSRDELVEWEARLDELGITHGGIVDADYGAGLSFRDLDGIALELFWDIFQ